MIVKIIMEGVLLGALLALICAVGIRKGAVTMVFLYHRDVQDRCVQNGLITRERIWQNRKIFKGLGIPLYFTFVLVSVYAVNGARGFWPGFWQLFAIFVHPEPDRSTAHRRILGGPHQGLGHSRHGGFEALYRPEGQDRKMAGGHGGLRHPVGHPVRRHGAGAAVAVARRSD